MQVDVVTNNIEQGLRRSVGSHVVDGNQVTFRVTRLKFIAFPNEVDGGTICIRVVGNGVSACHMALGIVGEVSISDVGEAVVDDFGFYIVGDASFTVKGTFDGDGGFGFNACHRNATVAIGEMQILNDKILVSDVGFASHEAVLGIVFIAVSNAVVERHARGHYAGQHGLSGRSGSGVGVG